MVEVHGFWVWGSRSTQRKFVRTLGEHINSTRYHWTSYTYPAAVYLAFLFVSSFLQVTSLLPSLLFLLLLQSILFDFPLHLALVELFLRRCAFMQLFLFVFRHPADPYPSLSPLLPPSSPSSTIFLSSQIRGCGLLSQDPPALTVVRLLSGCFQMQLCSCRCPLSWQPQAESFISLWARRVSQRGETSFHLSWFISSFYLCLMLD